MDPALKQRLVGAFVITALAAIFVPMMFDEPVETPASPSNQIAIPPPAQQGYEQIANKLPADQAQVMQLPEPQPLTASNDNVGAEKWDVLDANSLSDDEMAMPTPPPPPPTPRATAPTTSKTTAPPAAKSPANVAPVAGNPVTKPAPTSPATAKPVAPAAVESKPATAPAESRWVVQLGSFSQRDKAEQLINNLKNQGFGGFIHSVQIDGKTLYRVRVGPELDRKRAETIKNKIGQQNPDLSLIVMPE